MIWTKGAGMSDSERMALLRHFVGEHFPGVVVTKKEMRALHKRIEKACDEGVACPVTTVLNTWRPASLSSAGSVSEAHALPDVPKMTSDEMADLERIVQSVLED